MENNLGNQKIFELIINQSLHPITPKLSTTYRNKKL